MKVMVIVKATPELEADDSAPKTEDMEAMGAFNEELVKAGILLAADGLKPSSHGARVLFDGDERTVVDGPFAESKELIAGYWIWQVDSFDEALEWARKIPNPTGEQGVVELRPVWEFDEFDISDEHRAQLDRIHAEAEAQKKARQTA